MRSSGRLAFLACLSLAVVCLCLLPVSGGEVSSSSAASVASSKLASLRAQVEASGSPTRKKAKAAAGAPSSAGPVVTSFAPVVGAAPVVFADAPRILTWTAPIPNSPSVPDFIQCLKSKLGIPYLYGGSTDAGYDCSGLTSVCAKAANLIIPRTARLQILWEKGTKVAVSAMLPGDLVFFGSPVPYHVAAYIGKGSDGKNLYIHAPTTGRLVSYESSMETQAAFNQARRMFPVSAQVAPAAPIPDILPPAVIPSAPATGKCGTSAFVGACVSASSACAGGFQKGVCPGATVCCLAKPAAAVVIPVAAASKCGTSSTLGKCQATNVACKKTLVHGLCPGTSICCPA